MKDYLSEIDERYPVRNSTEQKENFRSYALSEAGAAGLSARAEENEGHVNLVFAEPAGAKLIFTAHYDTPRRAILPNLMLVTNRLLSLCYTAAVVLLILLPSLGAAFAVRALLGLEWEELPARMLMLLVYTVVYFGLFFLFLRGPANRRNRNDNTSGTAAVLTLAKRLSGRAGAAFLLFDDEEKGKKGSQAFARAHPEIKENTLIVNMDCVGNGDVFVFCCTEDAGRDPLYAELKTAMEGSGLNVRFFPSRKARMNSDHRSFGRGVGVCACRYKPLVGYFADRIHTARDTVASPENVQRLAEALAAFAEQL